MNNRIARDFFQGDFDEEFRKILEKDIASPQSKIKKIMLKAIKNELTARQSEIIMLYYFKGMNISEISEKLGITHSAVSITMRRARNRLFRILKYTL